MEEYNMVEMAYTYKLDQGNITEILLYLSKVLIYLLLIGIIIVLFYYLVAIPAIEVLSNPFPRGSPFSFMEFFTVLNN